MQNFWNACLRIKTRKPVVVHEAKDVATIFFRKPNETFKFILIQIVLNLERGMIQKLYKRVET